MAKRGELKPMDAFEEGIRDNAVAYNVVMFQPGVSSRVYQSFEKLEHAIAYGKATLQEPNRNGKATLQEPNRIRSAMIYAIDEHNHHALVGTINRHNGVYKEVEVTRY